MKSLKKFLTEVVALAEDNAADEIALQAKVFLADIETLETEYLSAKSSEDCSREDYRSADDFLDQVVTVFDLEVGR